MDHLSRALISGRNSPICLVNFKECVFLHSDRTLQNPSCIFYSSLKWLNEEQNRTCVLKLKRSRAYLLI